MLNNTKNNSLNILNYLSNEAHTKEEIMQALNIKESTFYKCIKKIKESYIEIHKENDLYFTDRFSSEIQFSKIDTTFMAYMLALALCLFPEAKYIELNKTIKKLLYLSNKKAYDEVMEKFEIFSEIVYKKEFREKIEILEKYKNVDYPIRITLRTNREIVFTPIKFYFKQGKVHFYFLDNDEEKKKIIPLEQIVRIAPHTNEPHKIHGKETIFELYGKLSKSYTLKDFERVVDFDFEKIVIANNDIEKDKLFRRLLRYDTLCKVRFPKKDREKFQNLINLSLDNIEKMHDNDYNEEIEKYWYLEN